MIGLRGDLPSMEKVRVNSTEPRVVAEIAPKSEGLNGVNR